MSLMKDYLEKNQYLYADDQFTSVNLVSEWDLYQNDTYYCGTVRKDKIGLSNDIQQGKLKPGESLKVSDGTLVYCRWHDKRDIYSLGSNTDGSDTRKQRTAFQANEIGNPRMVMDYNKNMCGVDRFDRYRSYYEVGCATKMVALYYVQPLQYVYHGCLHIGMFHIHATTGESLTLVRETIQAGSNRPTVRRLSCSKASIAASGIGGRSGSTERHYCRP